MADSPDAVENLGVRSLNVEPAVVLTTTSSGIPIECVVTPYFKKDSNVLHIHNDQGGLRYDIPTDADLNLAVNSSENGEVTPLGSMSVEIVDGVPTINMIQQVKTERKIEGSEPWEENSLGLDPVPVYEAIEHPKSGLIKGKDRIQWQKILIDQAVKVAKDNGFENIRIMSGFQSKYFLLRLGHELRLAVQQYDRLVDADESWVPYNSEGEPIDNPQHRGLLKTTIRKLRDREITNEDVVRTLPPGTRPAYYQKQLK